jgi:hypothetical protein
MGYVVAAAVTYVLGVVCGLVLYTKSRRWCGVCGATLQCVECAGRADSVVPQPVFGTGPHSRQVEGRR